ncbi:cytochrome P450 2U1-like protein [Leptotrombidium deliense]|uniref:Cytochrome P450 2U1-like protein n=1 Tax=Leptotrombidium deliense TaxID=299467 RepID=A0A443S9G7_9ACAR|nr:cytochrome P450 2U1-like protein [Leptotrombidium deliense]
MIDILPEIRTFAYTFVIASLVYFLLWKKRKSPPGPYGLPIVGYYPFLGKDPIATIHQLSKKYGDVMCINLLGEDYWILNSYEAIEEALVTKGEIFAGRPSDEFNFLGIFGENTIAIWEGEQWRIPQKFVLSHLAQLGMGKSEFDLRMHGIFDSVEKYVDDHCGQPHDYSIIINEFTINTITALVCSKQYSYTDPTFQHIRKLLQNVFSSMEYFNMLLSGNLFKYYMKFTTQADVKLRNNFGEFRDYVSSLLKEREATFDENNCRDLLDYWLKESRKPNMKLHSHLNSR